MSNPLSSNKDIGGKLEEAGIGVRLGCLGKIWSLVRTWKKETDLAGEVL